MSVSVGIGTLYVTANGNGFVAKLKLLSGDGERASDVVVTKRCCADPPDVAASTGIGLIAPLTQCRVRGQRSTYRRCSIVVRDGQLDLPALVGHKLDMLFPGFWLIFISQR